MQTPQPKNKHDQSRTRISRLRHAGAAVRHKQPGYQEPHDGAQGARLRHPNIVLGEAKENQGAWQAVPQSIAG